MSSKSFIADLDRHGTVAYFCHKPMVLAALHEATNTIYPAIYGWELELSHVILRWLDSPNAVNYSSHLRSDNLGVSGEGRANLVAVFLFFIFRLLVMGGKRSCVFSGFYLKADFQLKMKNGLVVTPSITPFFDSPSLWDWLISSRAGHWERLVYSSSYRHELRKFQFPSARYFAWAAIFFFMILSPVPKSCSWTWLR